MKKKLLLSTIALMLLLVLCACGEKDAPDLSGVPNNPPTTDNQNDPPSAPPLTLSSAGSSTEYKLCTTLPDAYADEFINRFKLKTGVELSKTKSLSDGKLIVLCPAETLGSIEGLNATPSLTSYRIKVIGDNVFIPVSTSENPTYFEKTFAAAVNKFITVMRKDSATGSCTLEANTDIAADISGVKGIVPTVDNALFSKVYISGSGNQTNYQMCYLQVTSIDTVKAYTQKLSALGYTMSQENNMNGNLFATFVNADKDSKIHINWFKVNGRLNIVYGQTEYVASAQPVTGYQKKAEPTLSMLKLTETGLSMVAQLEDGRFIIVDGGTKGDENQTVLWNYLKERIPAGESKPRVTWIFTHNHSDHVGVPIKFLENHKNDIQLDLVIYNYPDIKTLNLGEFSGEETKRSNNAKQVQMLVDVIAKNFPNTPTYRPHAGEKLCLPGCELEFIFVQEDASHIGLQWLNDTSMVFRIKMGDGKTCMVYGDAEKTATDYIYSLYGSYLKSDIMQVPHHGRGSSSWELYSATDPYICLWSVCSGVNPSADFNDDMRTGKKAGYEYNKKLRDDSIRQRVHCHQSVISVVNMNNLTVTNPTK